MNGRGRNTALALLVAMSVAPLPGCGEDEPAAPEPPASATAQNRLPAGKYLYLGGALGQDRRLTIVDVDAGKSWVAKPPRFYPGDPPFPLLRRGHRLVYFGGGAGPYAGGAYSIDLNLLQRPRRLVSPRIGGFGLFIPSANPNRVWVGLENPSRPRRGLVAVREVSAGGRVITPEVRLPRGSWPMVGLRNGLAINPPHRSGVAVWSPRRGEITATVKGEYAYAANASLLVSGDAAYSVPALDFSDVRSGRGHTVTPPAGLRNFDGIRGAFAPDGHLFAVPVTRGRELVGARQLALINSRSGELRVVPGSRVARADGYVAWASDGRSVFMSGGANGPKSPGEIVVYRLGDRSAHRIPVRVGTIFGMAAS